MIVSYSFSNFLSISDEVEISFVKGEGDYCSDQVICDKDVELLRNLILFGKNGAGKSNVILSLAYVTRLIYPNPNLLLKRIDYLKIRGDVHNKNCNSSISSFKFIFSVKGDIISYSLDYDSVRGIFIKETVERSDGMCFKRNDVGELFLSDDGSAHFLKDCIHKIPDNQSIISFFGGLEAEGSSPDYLHDYATLTFKTIYHIFRNNVIFSFESENVRVPNGFFVRSDIIDYLERNLLKITDIEKIVVVEGNTQHKNIDMAMVFFESEPIIVIGGHSYTLSFKEYGHDSIVSFSDMSTGIRRIVVLLIVIAMRMELLDFVDSLLSTRLVVIDEMCYSLHPKITRHLMNLITQESHNNPTQFLYTMHDTNVLSMKKFRTDQFYLIDKKRGYSTINSLYDYDIRGNDLQMMYLEGRFGSTPNIGNYRRIK